MRGFWNTAGAARARGGEGAETGFEALVRTCRACGTSLARLTAPTRFIVIARVPPGDRGGTFIWCRRPLARRRPDRDIRPSAELRPCSPCLRARRGRMAHRAGWAAIPRFRGRRRRERPGPCPSAPRGQGLARLEPVPDPRGRAPRPPPRGGDLRGGGVLLQLGRRGERGGDQDRAEVPRGGRPSGALPDRDLRRRVPRAYPRHPRGGRPAEIHRRLRPEGRGLRPGADRRFRGLEKAIGPETAALMIEPVQGEGGVRVIPPADLRRLRDICDRHGLLLIMDEVQTGMGRTGKLFAYEWSGIAPDILSAAKGIGGGFPLGACLTTKEAARGMVAGSHGSTFGGNPLAMAVGNAVLDVILSDGFLERVAQTGLVLKQKLAALRDRHPRVIEEIRGEGLMVGLKLAVPNTEFAAAAREANLLVIPAGDNVVRLLPPLIVTEADVDEAVRRLDAAANGFSALRGAAE
ncbi:hypothetical protein Lal_00046453 [Lupinus albus]|nr:hypothetical protein Lal_00046453 [Lupinus albus]